MEQRIEQTILKNLIQSDEFTRKCIPYLKSEYFTEASERTIFTEINSYFEKYTKSPTTEALLINLDKVTNISDNLLKDSKKVVEFIGKDVEPTPQEWLVNETEQW